MKEIITELFVNYFDEEYDLIGKTRLNYLIDSAIKNEIPDIVTTEHGSNFDIKKTLENAFSIIVGIRDLIKLINAYKNEERVFSEDTIEQIKKNIDQALIEKLEQEYREEFINFSIRKLLNDE